MRTHSKKGHKGEALEGKVQGGEVNLELYIGFYCEARVAYLQDL